MRNPRAVQAIRAARVSQVLTNLVRTCLDMPWTPTYLPSQAHPPNSYRYMILAYCVACGHRHLTYVDHTVCLDQHATDFRWNAPSRATAGAVCRRQHHHLSTRGPLSASQVSHSNGAASSALNGFTTAHLPWTYQYHRTARQGCPPPPRQDELLPPTRAPCSTPVFMATSDTVTHLAPPGLAQPCSARRA